MKIVAMKWQINKNTLRINKVIFNDAHSGDIFASRNSS